MNRSTSTSPSNASRLMGVKARYRQMTGRIAPVLLVVSMSLATELALATLFFYSEAAMILDTPCTLTVVSAGASTSHTTIDLLIKVVAPLVAFLTVVLAVYKHFDERRRSEAKIHEDSQLANDRFFEEKKRANDIAKTESEKPFSSKQQEVYFDLLATTAFIANRITHPDDDPDRKRAIEHFWCLFWGPLPVVANQKVAIAADVFSVALDYPMNFVPLRNASMDLARACRSALGTAWSIGLEKYEKGDAAIAKETPKRNDFYPQSGPISV